LRAAHNPDARVGSPFRKFYDFQIQIRIKAELVWPRLEQQRMSVRGPGSARGFDPLLAAAAADVSRAGQSIILAITGMWSSSEMPVDDEVVAIAAGNEGAQDQSILRRRACSWL
jgi:hypothetical protein